MEPTIGKAVISADGKHVSEIKPKSHGKLPIDQKTRDVMEQRARGRGHPRYRGVEVRRLPQDKIALHAKTGTAEVYGKQTTSWLATTPRTTRSS